MQRRNNIRYTRNGRILPPLPPSAVELAGKPKKTTKGMVERWEETKHSDEVRNQRKQWRKVDGFMHLRM